MIIPLSYAFCAFLLLPATWAAEGAAPFPKPDPVGTYAEMKLPLPGGRVWRTPTEDWAGARKRIAEDPDWKQWYEARKAEVDDWMARRHDRAEWVAGWGHEFVSPKDGSFLIWSPEVPGEGVKTLASKSDPQVAVTPAIFRAWVVSFRAINMRMVQDAAILWRLTGDARYVDWVKAQLDFYADNFEGWPVQDRFYGPSRLFGQPLDGAANVAKLTDAVRLIWDQVAPAHRQLWFERLFKPEAVMLNQSMHRIHNIACWLRSFSAQVALLYDDKELWDDAVDGPWGIRQQIEQGVTSDYLWFEQSNGYNEFAVRAMYTLFLSAGLQGKAASFDRQMAIVQDLVLAPTWLRFPDDSMPNPADTTVTFPHYAPLKRTLLSIYRMLPTPVGLAEARESKSWDTLVDPPPAPPAPMPPLPVVTSHDYHSTRFAVMKSGDWQVFFHYGQLTGSHAQAEALNFEAHYGLTDVTHDAYTVGYGSPMHRGYFTRGLAQNVPLINGEGSLPGHEWPTENEAPGTLPQRGKLLEFDAGKAIMAAAQPVYRKDAQAERTLRIEGSRLIDETTISTTVDSPQALGLALQVQGKVQRPTGWQSVADFATGRPAPFGYWQDVQSAVFHDQASFDVVYRDGLIMRITFSTPGEFCVYIGSSPDSPVPARRDAFYLETQGRKATFTTEFSPQAKPNTAATTP
jgi:hypothetical protein